MPTRSEVSADKKSARRGWECWRVAVGCLIGALMNVSVMPGAYAAGSTATGRSAPNDYPAIGVLARATDGWATTRWAPVPVFEGKGGSTPFQMLDGTSVVPPVVLVTENPVDGWAHVLLPQRAGIATGPRDGWIRADGLEIRPATYGITVDRAKHQMVVRRTGNVVRRFLVAVGGGRTPTVS